MGGRRLGASRYEPHSHHCRELDVLVATGRLLHARLASALPTPPAGIGERSDRWARAERAAFDGRVPEGAVSDATGTHGIPLEHAGPLVMDLAAHLAAHLAALDDTELGPDQLVHADLAGNVLLDGRGVPVVIDVAPCWRPALWAEAVCVLDAVLWHGASPSVMGEWTRGAARQAMLRAGLFRLLSDDPAEPTLSRYRTLLLDPPGTSGH